MKRIIIANWGMNPKTIKEAMGLLSQIKGGLPKSGKRTDIIVCPPFPYISNLAGNGLKIGAQNCFVENGRSITGEVSSQMLSSLGVKHVIVGHSERRRLGEGDEEINKKAKNLLKNGFKVILCVGESARDISGAYLRSIESQLLNGLKKVRAEYAKNLFVAYEPSLALSATGGVLCDARQTGEIFMFIRKTLAGIFGREVGLGVPVLYGGFSCRRGEDNFLSSGADGLFLGRISLDGKNFLKIVDEI